MNQYFQISWQLLIAVQVPWDTKLGLNLQKHRRMALRQVNDSFSLAGKMRITTKKLQEAINSYLMVVLLSLTGKLSVIKNMRLRFAEATTMPLDFAPNLPRRD